MKSSNLQYFDRLSMARLFLASALLLTHQKVWWKSQSEMKNTWKIAWRVDVKLSKNIVQKSNVSSVKDVGSSKITQSIYYSSACKNLWVLSSPHFFLLLLRACDPSSMNFILSLLLCVPTAQTYFILPFNARFFFFSSPQSRYASSACLVCVSFVNTLFAHT